MGRKEQAQLAALIQDHATAISISLDALRIQFTPLDASFHVVPGASSAGPGTTNWQDGSIEALETAKVIDHLVRALLMTNQAPAAPDAALPLIDQNLTRLSAELKNFMAVTH